MIEDINTTLSSNTRIRIYNLSTQFHLAFGPPSINSANHTICDLYRSPRAAVSAPNVGLTCILQTHISRPAVRYLVRSSCAHWRRVRRLQQCNAALPYALFNFQLPLLLQHTRTEPARHAVFNTRIFSPTHLSVSTTSLLGCLHISLYNKQSAFFGGFLG